MRPHHWTIQLWHGPGTHQASWRNLIRSRAGKAGGFHATVVVGRWKCEVAPSKPTNKHNNLIHNVSLRSSDLTTIALHIPLTSPWNPTIMFTAPLLLTTPLEECEQAFHNSSDSPFGTTLSDILRLAPEAQTGTHKSCACQLSMLVWQPLACATEHIICHGH